MKQLKKALLATIVLVFAIAAISNATIRRIGYWGTPTALDYTSLQNAYNASVAGDTLLVFPTTSGLGGISSVTHKIVIIGCGRGWGTFSDYGIFDTANYNLQTLAGFPNITSINLNAGSDSSVISSLFFNNGSCYINGGTKSVNGVIVQRCIFWNGNSVYLDGNNNGNIITGNYFAYGCVDCNYYTTNYSTTNVTVSNNIFRCNSAGWVFYQYGVGVTGVIRNNIFRDPNSWGGNTTQTPIISIPTGQMLIINNISNGLTLTAPNCMFFNNIGTGTEWPISASSGSGNLQNIPYSSIFINSFNNSPTLSPEARFVLKANSPAVGYYFGGSAASGGGSPDCGIYGGPTPHVLSGMPAEPVIYNVTGPANNISNGATLQLSISTKALN